MKKVLVVSLFNAILLTVFSMSAQFAKADEPSAELQPGKTFIGRIQNSRTQGCTLKILDRDIEQLKIRYMMGNKENFHFMATDTIMKWNGLEHAWKGESYGEEGALTLFQGLNGEFFLKQQVSQYPDPRFPNPALCELLNQ